MKFAPMKCRDVRTILKNLEFERVSQKGSHEQWKTIRKGKMFKVTLACHKGEVGANDVRSMIRQAGVSKKVWYDAL